jgi:rhodanese-related sulfurtransferase
MNIISSEDLKNKINSGDEFILLNVVTPEHHEIEHIPGSKNVCVYEIAFLAKMKTVTFDKNKEIIVYGKNSKFNAAKVAFEKLDSAGYKNVSVYEDGIDSWKLNGFDVEGSKDTESVEIMNKKYSLDENESFLEWEGTGLSSRHFGEVSFSSGDLEVQDGKISKGEFVVDMNSIKVKDIRNWGLRKILVNHLKTEDFFLVGSFPEAKLVLKEVNKIQGKTEGENNYSVVAGLTIRDNTSTIEFEMQAGVQKEGLVAHGYFEIDRTKFGSVYGSSKFFEWLGKHLVSDDIGFKFKITVK